MGSSPRTLASRRPHPTADRRPTNPFPEGSIVEVRSEDPDFRETYFAGTVTSPILGSPRKGRGGKNSKKVMVEYHTLFVDEAGTTRLKEEASIQSLRPSPPFQELVEGYEPGDTVDAFFQEGWWIGVVARVVEGEERRYVVTFQSPPDEREFGVSELRVHWDWMNGSWLRPDRLSEAGLMFDVGRKVEVSFDKENHLGVWFPGTIHQRLANGTYLVKYCSENSDKGTVLVDSQHLRPSPPLFKEKNFTSSENVDAFFDSGWWSGIIKQEFENNSYLVFFKHLNVEKQFDQSRLRSHLNWRDDKWFTSTQVLSALSFEGGGSEHVARENLSVSVATTPVRNSGDGKESKDTFDGKTSDVVDVIPSSQKTSHVRSLTKQRQHLSVSHGARSKAHDNLKGNALGANQQEVHDNSITEMTGGSVIVDTVGKQCAPVEHSSDNSSRGKRTRNAGGKIKSSSSARNSSALTATGKELAVVDNMAADVQNEIIKTGAEVIIGLPCAEMLSSPGFKKSRGKVARCSNKEVLNNGGEEKEQLDDHATKKTEKIKLPETAVSSDNRKRGRPRKAQNETIQTVTDYLTAKDDTPPIIPEVEAIDVEISPLPNQDNSTNGRSDTNGRRTSTRKRSAKKVFGDFGPQQNNASKRGKLTTVLQSQDLIDASGGKSKEVNPILEVNVVCDAPIHEFENQPLSKWVEGMRPSTEPTPVSAVEQPMEIQEKDQRDIAVVEEIIEKSKGSEVSIPKVVDKHPVVVMEPRNWPFAKNNHYWKILEEMDALKKLPQNPHFQPLEQIKEPLREGKAIGFFINFADVFGRISELNFSDPKSVADDFLDSLAELEMQGFNVRPLKDRVAELVEAKGEEENLMGNVKELSSRIQERYQVKEKVEEEIGGAREEIRKLQETLMVSVAVKGKVEDEILDLGEQLNEAEKGIENVRRRFEGRPSVFLCG